MARERLHHDWMNDPKNLAIALLVLVVALFGAALFGQGLPAGAGLHARSQAEGEPVSVLDVIVDRQQLRTVDVLLDRPVGEGKVGEVLGADAATIRPALGGTWRWQGDSILRFEPSGGLGMAMRYELALVGDRFLPPGRYLAGEDTFEIVTDRFRVERVDTVQEPTADGEAVQVRGQIYFNYPVDPETLASRVRLLDPAAEAPVGLSFETYYPQKVIGFHSDPLRKQRQERELRLVIEAGLTPAEGNVPLADAYVHTLTLGSSEVLSVWEVEAEPGDPDSRVIVRLSSPVDAAVAGDYLEVSPDVGYRLGTRRNELVLTGPFRPGSEIELSLRQGLPARDRAVLPSNWATRVFLPDMEPRLDFAAQGMFLSASGNRALQIESVNVDRARLLVERVYPNNLFYLFNAYSWMVWNQESYAGSAVSHALGDRLADETLELPAAPNRVQRTPLQLERWVDLDRPGLYRVVLARPGDSRASQRWVLVTDVGLVAKRGERDVLLWASSFADLRPLPGTRLRLLSDQNQLIAEGRTDAGGLWHVRDLPLEGQRPYLVLADHDGDTSFLLLDGMQVDTTGLDVSGAGSSVLGYQAFLYGERDIYRPGEMVEGAAVVRDRRLEPPPDMPLRLRHLDPTGLERESLRVDLQDGGVAPFELEVPAYARTGGHTLELLAGEDRVGTYRFQVEEFVPDRIRVDIDAPEGAVTAGERLEVRVQAAYLFGPPAEGLPVETRIRLESRLFAPAGFAGYAFVSPDRSFSPTELFESRDRLDDRGTLVTGAQLPDGLRVPSALQAVVTARVQEQGGRGVLARRVVPVHPYPHYVGLRRTASEYAEPGIPEEFEFVVVDPEGEPTVPRALRAELIRDEWQTVLRRTPSGNFRYESTRDSRLVDAIELEPARAGSFRMTVPELGAYRVVLSDPLAGPAAEVSFTASGFGFSPWAIENPARVELELDRDEYLPGQTAAVQVRSPFPGRLLLTVERDGVARTMVRTLEGNTATLSVPVDASLRPNAYVTATVVRAAGSLEPGSVGRAFGAVPIYVDRAANRLATAVEAPAEMRPEQPLEVTVRTEPGAKLTVAVVDEGILQLIAQETPDPFEFFYRKLRLGVSSYDTFSLLLPEVDVEGVAAVGGGELAERAAQFVRTEGIRRVRPVAFWSGVLEAGDDGVASASFDVPEFQGALRVMAVAYHGRRFGSAESMVRVRDPLVLLPTLPRFLAFGDRVRIPVGVRNDTGAEAAVRVALTADLPGGQSQESSAEIEVADGQQQTIYFELRAPERVGDAEISLVASAAGESTRSTATVPVRPDLPAVTDRTAGVLSEAVTVLDAVPADRFRAAGRERQLRIGPTPLLPLSGRLHWLLRYPYGCLEQVTSGAFPLVWLGDLAREIDPDAFAAGASPAAVVQEAVRRIGSYQTFSGAFALWPGSDDVQPWASIYSAHFLVEARAAGFQVPAVVYDRAMGFLQQEARARTELGRDQLQRTAYAVYVLARAGMAETGTMDYLRERHMGAMSALSRSLLGAAYAAVGNVSAVDDMVAALGDIDAVNRQTGGNFNSPVRNRAVVLLALLDAAPADPRIPEIADRLAREASAGGLWSTQETAFALLALGRYYGSDQEAETASGRVLAGGLEVGRFGEETRVFDDLPPDAPIRVELDAGRAYYSLQTRGIVTDEAFAPERSGMEVGRVFLSREGGPVDLGSVRQGDLLAVRIRVRSTSGPLQNVVVQNLLPAGLEVENPRLTGSETLSWIRDADLYTPHVDIRDDGVLLFVDLPDERWHTAYALVRAVSPGTFRVPPLQAEAMYAPEIRATGPRQVMTVQVR